MSRKYALPEVDDICRNCRHWWNLPQFAGPGTADHHWGECRKDALRTTFPLKVIQDGCDSFEAVEGLPNSCCARCQAEAVQEAAQQGKPDVRS